jgi:preprotein translocase subunit YajC
MSAEPRIAWIFQQEPKAAPQEPRPTERRDTGTASTQQPDPGQQQRPAQQPNPCGGDTLLYMLPMLAVLYFIMVRPAQKQNKQRQELLKAIKKGDRVVTNGGMHGEIAAITDQLVVLKVDTIKMTVDRSAIAKVVRDEPKAETADDKARKG